MAKYMLKQRDDGMIVLLGRIHGACDCCQTIRRAFMTHGVGETALLLHLSLFANWMDEAAMGA